MLVRLAFAVIAHVDADILIIDEALAVGDTLFTQKCMRFLRTFMQRGTVLFVSHDIEGVKSLCNRVIWLEKGQVKMSGAPKRVCEAYLQAQYEELKGKSIQPPAWLPSTPEADDSLSFKDPRLQFIQHSQLRNDLELFSFDPNAASMGVGGARLIDVRFLDKQGQPLSWVIGGERVILQIRATIFETLDKPIMGFSVKDRLGQALFGDNTFLSYHDRSIFCQPGDVLEAQFVFDMPILPKGDYVINAAIANGTQLEHVQHHMIHDALLFTSQSSSVATGLIGIPMKEVKFISLNHQEG
jgi:lipopolysaccharide transport system ATP-binding protein